MRAPVKFLASLVFMLSVSLPAFTQTPSFDLYREALKLQLSGESQNPHFDRVLHSFNQYRAAPWNKQLGRVRKMFVRDLQSLAKLDAENQIEAVGELIYFAARLRDRNESVELLADIFNYCPMASSMQFTYSMPAAAEPGKSGDIITVLAHGFYLEPEPSPMDENSRVSVKKFEIPAWDEASLQELKRDINPRSSRSRI